MIERILQLLARIPQDKLLHVLGGVLMAAAGWALGLALGHPWGFAWSLGIVLSVWKEAWDARRPGHSCDFWDAVASVLGTALALVLIWLGGVR